MGIISKLERLIGEHKKHHKKSHHKAKKRRTPPRTKTGKFRKRR